MKIADPLILREQNMVLCQRTLDLCSGNQVRILAGSTTIGTENFCDSTRPL